jgi:hypothetical protein
MSKENIIKLIKERIKTEYDKHKNLEWDLIAAKKIYNNLYEPINNINMELNTYNDAKLIRAQIKTKKDILDNFEKKGHLIELGLVHKSFPMGEKTKYIENLELLKTIENLIKLSLKDEIDNLERKFNCL